MRTFIYTTLFTGFWSVSILASTPPVRLVVDQAPHTLNPRMALDASGQRIGAMIFSGLTRIGPDFRTEPDLAESWKNDPTMKRWTFQIARNRADHAGQAITAQNVQACLEEYRAGKPRSLVGANFARWRATNLIPPHSIEIVLDEADPYFPKSASLLRYFRFVGAPAPCSEPPPKVAVIASGPLRPETWISEPKGRLVLQAVDERRTRSITLVFVRDELTRLLYLLRGNVDGGLTALSLSKTQWLAKSRPKEFSIIEQAGVNVQYLAYNLRHPILAKREVRQALSLAIDRAAFSQQKSFGFLTPVGSFLSPILPEAQVIPLTFNPGQAERMLDAAGYPRKADGIRFRLRYKTTPLRDGFETGQYIRECLARIGVKIDLETVESALLIASMRKGQFDLYSSRWVGVSDASILWRTLHSTSKSNRVGYQNAEMDALLGEAMAEGRVDKRTALMKKIQLRMAEDLPYAPLWIWNTQFIIRRDRAGEFAPAQVSPSAALEPLTRRTP